MRHPVDTAGMRWWVRLLPPNIVLWARRRTPVTGGGPAIPGSPRTTRLKLKDVCLLGGVMGALVLNDIFGIEQLWAQLLFMIAVVMLAASIVGLVGAWREQKEGGVRDA